MSVLGAAHPRGHGAGLPPRRPGVDHRPAALLQPHRRPQLRRDRRGPQRDSQQPAALHPAGRRRPAARAQRLRPRLPHPGRHRGACVRPFDSNSKVRGISRANSP
jgi:hypothetical protein